MTQVKKFIRQYRKYSAVAALLVFIVLAAAGRHYFGKDSSSSNSADLTTVQAEIQVAPRGIVRQGIVETPALLPISSGFSGRISEVYVKEGQAVKAGERLFKLEAAPIGAEASSELGKNPRTGALPAAPANAEKAQIEYNRFRKLYEQGIISRRELENAENRLQVTKQGSISGQSASTPVNSEAPAIATAPIEGIVTGLAVTAGSSVQADQLVLSLGSGQTVEVVVPLEQKELYSVQLGTSATIEAGGQTIRGEVSSIFPEVKDNALFAFFAHINLANFPAGSVQAGMSAKVHIDVDL